MVKPWILLGSCALLAVAAAAAAIIPADVVAQLACPVSVTKVVAAYGPAGLKFKPAFYADTNPDKTDKLWVAADLANAGQQDTITKVAFEILAWNANGDEVFKVQEVYDYPLRDRPGSKEWSWVVPDGGVITRVIFIPRVITMPGGMTWQADEDFVNKKLAELRGAK